MPVALDTETELATNARPIPRLVSVALCVDGAGPELLHRSDPDLPRRAAEAYRAGVIIHNAPFDGWVLAQAFPDLLPEIVAAYQGGRVFDTSTREKLIDIAEGAHFQRGRYDLGSVAERRAGLAVDKSDPWRKRYGELIDTPIPLWPVEAQQYALRDVWAHWCTWAAQEDYAAQTRPGLFLPAATTAAKHFALYAQTLRGAETDPATCEQLSRLMQTEIETTAATLVGYGLARRVGRKLTCDTRAAQLAIVQHCAATGQPIKYTNKGQVSLAAEYMSEIAIPDGHPLDAYRRHKGLKALWTKNIPVFRHPVVRTRYDEAKDTGRAGSSSPMPKGAKAENAGPDDWVGTNLQNIVATDKFREAVRAPEAPGMREIIRASDGERLIISDWSGFELATLAQHQLDVLGYSPLAEALLQGENPHTSIACAWLGISIMAYDKKNAEHRAERQLAKKWNFGRWGGMGDTKFRQIVFRDTGMDMPLSEVRNRNQIWKDRWQAKLYFDWVKRQPKTEKYLDDGRRMSTYTITNGRSGWTKGGCTYTEACNFSFQHLAAMAAGTALWWLWLDSCDPASPLYRGERPTTQILFVHDEIVSSVPAHLAEAARERQDELMTMAARAWCPDVPVGVESDTSDRYNK